MTITPASVAANAALRDESDPALLRSALAAAMAAGTADVAQAVLAALTPPAGDGARLPCPLRCGELFTDDGDGAAQALMSAHVHARHDYSYMSAIHAARAVAVAAHQARDLVRRDGEG